jgi:hypothetical protein
MIGMNRLLQVESAADYRMVLLLTGEADPS